jgi:hypothetical protein
MHNIVDFTTVVLGLLRKDCGSKVQAHTFGSAVLLVFWWHLGNCYSINTTAITTVNSELCTAESGGLSGKRKAACRKCQKCEVLLLKAATESCLLCMHHAVAQHVYLTVN